MLSEVWWGSQNRYPLGYYRDNQALYLQNFSIGQGQLRLLKDKMSDLCFLIEDYDFYCWFALLYYYLGGFLSIDNE